MNTLDKYKNGEISVYEAIKYLDINNNSNDKKNEGVIYTPKEIAKEIVENLNYTPNKTILEPSVGHGVFVFTLIEYVKSKFNLSGLELKKWFEDKVCCIDINKKNIEDLKELLVIYFEKEGVLNINLSKIINEDGLFYNYPSSFDFSFGNPPYIRTKNIEENYLKKLRKEFVSCSSGNVDIFYAFIEKTNKISNISSFIVPNSYIQNKSALNLRNVILKDIESIIDFKEKLIFKDARTYTSIYKTNKLKKNLTLKYKETIESNFVEIDKKSLNEKQWVLTKDKIQKLSGTSIIELYSCYGSIATLKDKIYLIENPIEKEIDSVRYITKIENNKEYLIESDLCVDFIKITKLNKKFKLIYPYKNEKIINEEDLKQNYPKGYKYLQEVKEVLNKRDKGKTEKYDSWYAYGRKQSLSPKKEKFYLLMPLMATEKYICTILRKEDNFMSTSGFVLGFETEEEMQKTKKTLESGLFFNYIKNCGKVWAGKNPYYSFTKTHLKDFLI